MKLWPDLSQLSTLYGAVLYKLGDASSAYRALNHAHELNPQDEQTASFLYDVSIALAKESIDQKHNASALQYLREAAELHPDDPELHRQLAETYSLAGQPERSAEERLEAERLAAQSVTNSK